MPVTVREANTPSDYRKALKFTFNLYRDNPNWVPPLIGEEMETFNPKKNPALEFCETKTWLAERDGRIVGRITGILNRRFIEQWKDLHARFGWLEFIDDAEVADSLFDAAEAWARERGMTAIVGPMGFTDFDKEGLLVEGFDELSTFAMLYNHPWYKDHLERRGYVKEVDWIERQVRVPAEGIPEKVMRVSELVFKRKGLRALTVRRAKDYKPYIPAIFALLEDTYAHLYGYVSLTEKLRDLYADRYFSFIDPDFTKLVLDSEGKLAAVGISMPSLSRAAQKAKGRLFPFGLFHFLRAMKKPEILDLYLVAVRKDLQNLGLNSILMNEITANAIRRGVKFAETNAELESNAAIQSFWKFYDAREHKRRRVYRKDL